MPYLQRLRHYPGMDQLSEADRRHVQNHFDTYGAEMRIDSDIIPWNVIEEVEVARAPGVMGAMGWLVRRLAHGGMDRYHVALYYGFREAVLHDISLEAARYILQMVAYYAPHPVRYTGPEGLAPVTDY
jgi:hypothetical protein